MKKAIADDVGDQLDAQVHGHHQNLTPIYRYSKLALLTCCWLIFTASFLLHYFDMETQIKFFPKKK